VQRERERDKQARMNGGKERMGERERGFKFYHWYRGRDIRKKYAAQQTRCLENV
jgi:hypothetical protein